MDRFAFPSPDLNSLPVCNILQQQHHPKNAITAEKEGGGEDAFILHTPQLISTSNNGNINNADANKEKENKETKNKDNTACLFCIPHIKFNEKNNKYISQKYNHHFCEQCIKTWCENWDFKDDVDVKTLECLYPRCIVHHDRMGGSDSQCIEQSYVKDKLTMSHLLNDSIHQLLNNAIRKLL